MNRWFHYLAVALALAPAAPVSGGLPPRPREPGYEVSSNTGGDQQGIDVSITPDEDFVVAWQSDIGLTEGLLTEGLLQISLFRGFDVLGLPLGLEVQLGLQAEQVAIAVDHGGLAFVVWQDLDLIGTGVQASRCLLVVCVPLLGVNTTFFGDQGNPSVAVTPSGNAFVVWESAGQGAGGSDAIVGRYFPLIGLPSGEILIAEGASAPRKPIVASDAAGTSFTVAWEASSGALDEVRARRYGSSGPLGAEILVAGDARDPSLDLQPVASGVHVFTWVGDDPDGSGILARYASADLSTLGTPFLVNELTAGEQTEPDVAVDGSAAATWVWRSETAPALLGSPIYSKGIRGVGGLGLTEFVGGAVLTPEFEIAAAPQLGRPRISGQAQGNFVVSWHQESDQGLGAFVRRYGVEVFGDGFETGDLSFWSSEP